tara:strand:+ start:90 stop:245 length:156 start_codon:yes stop_codon:yes gene_type:complete
MAQVRVRDVKEQADLNSGKIEKNEQAIGTNRIFIYGISSVVLINMIISAFF